MTSLPNVLLIVMDTARAKTVYDHPEVMPNVHEIAQEGTTFTNAFSTAPWTLPSHASMFTGRYTSGHGTHARSTRFDPEYPPLARRLDDAGYRTAAFSNNTWIAPEFGFGQGFDQFSTWLKVVDGGVDLEEIARGKDGLVEQGLAVGKSLFRRDGHRTFLNAVYAKFLKERYDSGARLNNWKIRRWLTEHGDGEEPFFVFANYLEPHLDYDPPGEFRTRFLPADVDRADLDGVNQDPWAYICDQVSMDRTDFEALRALYRGELNYLDYRLGNLYDHLDESGLLEETLIVIVGDHGENIGEHGLMDHQYCLYDTLLRVPLLVRYPEAFPPGERFDGLVEVRDLFPTILQAADQSVTDPAASDESLQQALDDGGREYVFGEYAAPRPSMEALEERVGDVPPEVREYDRALRSIRSEEWKLIQASSGETELYDVAAGRDETNDVSDEAPDTVASLSGTLERKLDTFELGADDETTMSQSTRERLEELGYLQG